MRRRAAITGALALCAAGGSASQSGDLVGLFADPARARRLGSAYLKGLGEQPTAAALGALVWRDIPGGGTLRTEVAALIRRDFAEERLACVEGWLLSQTEARLCALAALS